MIRKSSHPWSNFLHARRLAMQWMRDKMKYGDKEIAKEMSMDTLQVTLILMTEVEK